MEDKMHCSGCGDVQTQHARAVQVVDPICMLIAGMMAVIMFAIVVLLFGTRAVALGWRGGQDTAANWESQPLLGVIIGILYTACLGQMSPPASGL
jgi:hypothetical protein